MQLMMTMVCKPTSVVVVTDYLKSNLCQAEFIMYMKCGIGDIREIALARPGDVRKEYEEEQKKVM